MKVAKIQFTPWDKIYDFSVNNIIVAVGDYVVVKTELGTEIGQIMSFAEVDETSAEAIAKPAENKKAEEDAEAPAKEKSTSAPEEALADKEIKPIIRKATSSDLEKIPNKKDKQAAVSYCKKMVDKNELPMKLVDAHFSFDGSRLTFAFIADGRVDFRELVKDLTRHFNRTIRLHQIGIRDEAKLKGDYGHCGQVLCCQRFLKNFSSITSDMAEVQQVVHRGSERISGICGRLMCCLGYEEEGYQELAKKLPALGAKVNVDGKRGVVVGHHVLKQSVNVKFPGEKNGDSVVVEVDLNRNKK